MRSIAFSLVLCVFAGCSRPDPSADGDSTHTRVHGENFIRTNDGTVVPLALVEVSVYNLEVITAHLTNREADAAPKVKRLTEMLESDLKSLEGLADRRRTIQNLKTKSAEARAYIRRLDPDPSSTSRQKAESDFDMHDGVIDSLERLVDDGADKRVPLLRDDLERWPAASFYFNSLPKAEQVVHTDSGGKFVLDLLSNKPVVLVASTERLISNNLTEHYYWMVRFVPSGRQATIMLANQNLATSGGDESLIKAKKGKLCIDPDDPVAVR